MIEGSLFGRIVASHAGPDGVRVVDEVVVDKIVLAPLLGLHDATRCGQCRRLREAVAAGRVACTHHPDATECELCLLGTLP